MKNISTIVFFRAALPINYQVVDLRRCRRGRLVLFPSPEPLGRETYADQHRSTDMLVPVLHDARG